jgi:hypothetical protein
MVTQCFGTPRQQDLQALRPFDQADQHGSRTQLPALVGQQIDQLSMVPGQPGGWR